MDFRKDINGLRAIAVIAVVLFHFNASWLPGGFAGVDVFFVISGFLMTSIIFRGLEENNFSILKFYISRANRIIPALSLLCLILLIFGWFYLIPLDYRELGKHVASSLAFVSNIVYWREAGYFDAGSHEKWLLHTWSLSVEWQFYIIYPLVLIALSKLMSINAMKLMVVIGTILCLILSVIASYQWQNSSYFLLPTRAWEMMIGGVAYLYPLSLKETSKKFLEWMGVIMIIASYFLISSENPWPGVLALFPVMGAFFIIQAQRSESLITGNIFFQKLGAWSYSIYLWHWPIVVVIYYFSLDEIYIYPGIILSIIFGYLSYTYVEKIKFKRDFGSYFSYLKSTPPYIALVVGGLGFFCFQTNGVYARYTNEQKNILKNIAVQKDRPAYDKGCFSYFEVKPCTYLDGEKLTNNEPSHILLGDSHAEASVNALVKALSSKENFTGLKFYGMAGCIFSENIDKIHDSELMTRCGNLVRKSLDEIVNKYPELTVIFINRYNGSMIGGPEAPITDKVKENFILLNNGLSKTMDRLAQNRKIYLLTPVPEFNVPVLKEVAKNYLFNDSERVQISTDKYKSRNILTLSVINNLAKNFKNINVLDLAPYFCDHKYCYGDKDSIPLYKDTNHVSEYGAHRLIPLFKQIQ